MKHIRTLLATLFIVIAPLSATQSRRCIILLDKNDFAENVGRSERFYLMSKLQAAIEEQSTPILVHASLWNSFIERRTFVAHALNDTSSNIATAHDLYMQINERIAYWHDHYRTRIADVAHRKELIVQHINQEFYIDTEKTITDSDYQLLLNYFTPFNAADWQIYTNEHGFFLFLPKKYCAALAADYDEKTHGFNTSSLTRVEHPDQAGSLYFASRLRARSINEQLSDFFITDTNTYSWDIILSGHGGSTYYETMSHDGTLSWHAVPIIADLPLDQFHATLKFFNDRVNTHSLHYSGCFSGGHHSVLPFQQSYPSYNYALMYACLTDCDSYCKWDTNLPSSDKKYLSIDDFTYNAQTHHWQLPITSPYNWDYYFNQIASFDFTTEDITSLNKALFALSQNMLADLCSICAPQSQQFYHLYPATFAKISDHMVTLAQTTQKQIDLAYAHTILLESSRIEPTIKLSKSARFLSIKPGNAIHYCKKIVAETFLDITNAFWQLEGQWFDKIFLIDELTCPTNFDILARKYRHYTKDTTITIKQVLIHVSKDHIIRIFLTLGDTAYMIVAHNKDLLKDEVTIQEIVTLNESALSAYQTHYEALIKNL